ncbi:PDR/VanB family oxidoreductase [Jiulongibacter sediminis]|uniref:Diguanylate cyclase n=1 Tax=Jiulongibacter sediminis TaxID=1605367 RepID=A0A0P7BNY2_9BACT|nr:PDR/VanB family oxidoreductase [Jiulongibacter sediminis]KPM48919.1 hypothetical protein AFM12_10220 [Jiulongibacter sediminis]TBX25448.1 hypothetical protein TK44_10225 [Jiulongibacter sediminis]
MRFSNEWSEGRIKSIKQVGETVRQFEIDIPAEVSFSAGSHINVEVYFKGHPEIRSYSLVGKPRRTSVLKIAVKLLPESKGGSAYMWTLEEGQKIRVSQPKNHFELTYGSSEYVLLAGGIGITPMVSMAEELLAKGENFRFVYAAQKRSDMPFSEDLNTLLGDRLQLFVQDEHGLVDIPALVNSMKKGSQLYVCGPMGMLEAAKLAWFQSALPAEDLRYETFGTTGLYPTVAFKVNLPRFNKTVEVSANQTLLDALEEEGIEVMYDCKRGECGLCQVDIIEYSGTIDHRDAFFSSEERACDKKLCACVSRVFEGELTLDTSYRG